MYKIILREDVNKYGCEELIKIFLRPDLYDLFYAQSEVTALLEWRQDLMNAAIANMILS